MAEQLVTYWYHGASPVSWNVPIPHLPPAPRTGGNEDDDAALAAVSETMLFALFQISCLFLERDLERAIIVSQCFSR